MIKFVQSFLKDESGATAIEYALIAALISVAAIGAYNAVGGAINTQMTDVSTQISR